MRRIVMASGVLFKSNSQLFGKAVTYDADAAVEEVGLFDMDLENGSTWSPTRKVASSVDLSKLQQDMATLETICDASSVKEDVILRRVRRVLKGEEGKLLLSSLPSFIFFYIPSLGNAVVGLELTPSLPQAGTQRLQSRSWRVSATKWSWVTPGR